MTTALQRRAFGDIRSYHQMMGFLLRLKDRFRNDTFMKVGGGLVAAVLAVKYARSFKLACAVGIASGVISHSFYMEFLHVPRINREQPHLQ